MTNSVNKIDRNNLVSEFYKEYESKNGEFLLFDLANANENANTKVLKHLLQYNNYQFLNSFCARVGLPEYNNGEACIKEQENAIGGYMDLYIVYDNIHIVIENKIYGAGDTKQQLARYIATVNGVDEKSFDEWLANPSVSPNTYVVYLTADGTKEPSDDSLPSKLKDSVKYYGINYKDDILPWLKEDVLSQLPIGGIMSAGVLQYIAFLKQLLSDESSAVVDNYVKGLQGTDKEKYEILLSSIDANNNNVPENVLKSLRKQLEARAEAIFSADVQGEWVLHFTPSFIILYKKVWAALDIRKYSIPSLHICAAPTKEFLQKGSITRLSFIVDHLSSSAKEKYSSSEYAGLFSNHDRNIVFTLDNPACQCSDVNEPSARTEFYNSIINGIKPVIDTIDNVVAQLQNKVGGINPDVILDKIAESKLW